MCQYDLRKRNLSQTPVSPLSSVVPTEMNTTGTVTIVPAIPSPISSPTSTVCAISTFSNASISTQTEEKEIPVINMDHFKEVESGDKLDLLMAAINKINTTFHHKFENLKQSITKDGKTSKLQEIENTQQELQARIDDLESKLPDSADIFTRLSKIEDSVLANSDDIALLKGFSQVQDKQVNINKPNIVKLTARSMANNIIIHGSTPDMEGELCSDLVETFLKEKVKIDLQKDQIQVAHRLGKKIGQKPRPMVVRCEYTLKQEVFKYSKNLKDLTTDQGDRYYIKPQLPEPLYTEKQEREKQFRAIRKNNALIPEEQKEKRVDVRIKSNTLYINHIPQKQHIYPPTVQEIFEIDQKTQDKIDTMDCVYSATESEKASSFKGIAFHVKNTPEIKIAYKKVRQLFPEADHLMMGYVVKHYTGHADHGEPGAGNRILQKILNVGSGNTVVFVARKYGGQHLGPKRFMYIEKVTQDALNQLNPVK